MAGLRDAFVYARPLGADHLAAGRLVRAPRAPIQTGRRRVEAGMYLAAALEASAAPWTWSLRGAMAGPDANPREDWADAIVRVARDGDRAAYARLFAHFAPRLKSFLMRRGLADARAEEIAQDALFAVWRKAALYDPKAAGASTWIFAVARNLQIDARRRDGRAVPETLLDIEAEYQVDPAPLADASVISGERDALVRDAIGRLPEAQRRAIRLSFYEEKPHSEIAEALGIPLGTVKSRLRLAMERLKKLLGEAP